MKSQKIHEHPKMQVEKQLDKYHVIVDRDAFERVKKYEQTRRSE